MKTDTVWYDESFSTDAMFVQNIVKRKRPLQIMFPNLKNVAQTNSFCLFHSNIQTTINNQQRTHKMNFAN